MHNIYNNILQKQIKLFLTMNNSIVLTFWLVLSYIQVVNSGSIFDEIGFKIGTVQGYTKLSRHDSSTLYRVECPELDDGRPIKLAEIVADTHYDAGYAYGALLGPELLAHYHTFMDASFSHKWQIEILSLFLSWQYDNYVSKQIPLSFKEQIKGIQAAGSKLHNIHQLRSLIEMTLVISSYPSSLGVNILTSLFDEFLRDALHIKNKRLLNIIQLQMINTGQFLKKFLKMVGNHCSMFAVWGKRTSGGKLYSMRNLDWLENMGMNKFKLVTVWKVAHTIPHATIGFPLIIGALTGMSAAGLTVHEAGLESFRVTEEGFQWTLRLRYILMHASNLQQAKDIWQSTANTLGMTNMVTSAADLVAREPAFLVETMRDYTAWFVDHDSREDGTIFVDPHTNQKYVGGYSMDDVIFRTNHGYDPQIHKYATEKPAYNGSTMVRYRVLKDSFLAFEDNSIEITEMEAVKIGAAAAHKGGPDPYHCPGGADQGTNVISAVFVPSDARMYVSFEYGYNETYRTGGCGVYVNMDMSQWFR